MVIGLEGREGAPLRRIRLRWRAQEKCLPESKARNPDDVPAGLAPYPAILARQQWIDRRDACRRAMQETVAGLDDAHWLDRLIGSAHGIDFKILRCAVALARHQHFGRAAIALGISQPALSRRIATLERQLGIRIFERSPGVVVATPAGREILVMADELVTRASALSTKLDIMRSGRAGRLRLVAGAFVADVAVNAAVTSLIVANPMIQLEFFEADWLSAVGLVMTDRVDLAILDTTRLTNMPSLRFEPIGHLTGEYICRGGHPLLAQENPRPEDVRQYPMVLPRISREHAGWLQGIDTLA